MKLLPVVIFVLASSVSALGMAATRSVTLSVAGMTCPTCPITVREALKRIPGVEKIGVDYPARTVSVAYDAERTSVTALLKATSDAGYPAKVDKQVKQADQQVKP